MRFGNWRELLAFKISYALAIEIFEISRGLPPTEKYALTDQIRRCSGSVCTNLVEGYRRKRYENHFISKLNDCESENLETQVWPDFARDCHYITEGQYSNLSEKRAQAGRLLNYMIKNPKKFF